MIRATPEEQHELLDLQRVDTAIRQLEHRRANLPEQHALDQEAAVLRDVTEAHRTGSEEMADLERRTRHHEAEVATLDTQRKRAENREYSGVITTDRELEAMRNQVRDLKRRKSDHEDELLDIMERTEELTGELETLDQRQTDLRAEVARLTSARDDAAVEIDGELSAKRTERVGRAGGIGQPILDVYEKLRPRKQWVAVAALEGRSCSGCRLDLTAIELEDLKATVATGLARCPQCDRILVIP